MRDSTKNSSPAPIPAGTIKTGRADARRASTPRTVFRDIITAQKSPAALLEKILRGYLLPQWPLLTAGTSANLIAGGTTAALPFLIQKTADDVFTGGNTWLLWVIPVALVGIMFVRASMLFAANISLAFATRRFTTHMQKDLCAHLLHADYGTVSGTHSGRFLSVFISDTPRLAKAINTTIVGLTRHVFGLIALIAVMYYLNWELALVLMLCGPCIFFFLRLMGRRTRRASGGEMSEIASLSASLSEMLTGLRIVKTYGGETHEHKRVSSVIGRVVHHFIRATQAKSAASPAVEFIAGLGLAGVFFYAGFQGLAGTLTVGEFTGFMSAALLAYPPLRALARLNTVLQEGLAAGQRVMGLLEIEPSIVSAPDARALPLRKGEIRFDEVAFRYHADAPALRGVSFVVPAGTSCALVGPSGGGKSTIFNLIPRLYDADTGAVSIDGTDVRAATIESLRAHIALVSQDAFLFDDTIAANIAYGQPDATQADIEAAAQNADAHEFILSLPQGYDTYAGEAGHTLSGGQRQRIAIARAMLRDAPILLLDEPTAALDAESEAKIQTAIKRLMKGRTTLIIAHRLSTILHADTIHVLDKGRIIESGTHDDLLACQGLYARFYKKQFTSHDKSKKA